MIFIAIILIVYALLVIGFRSSPLNHSNILIAHRGASRLAPENTLASVRGALDNDFDYIEVDIRQSADGVLVLMHDRTINRVTNGKGRVENLTSEEIRQFSVQGEPIPLLENVLSLLSEYNFTLIAEVKQPKLYPAIAHPLSYTLIQYDALRRVIITSFDHKWLRQFQVDNPDVRTAPLRLLPRQVEAEVVSIFWLSVFIEPTYIHRMHKRNIAVWVWTIDHPLLKKALTWFGVDGIITNTAR